MASLALAQSLTCFQTNRPMLGKLRSGETFALSSVNAQLFLFQVLSASADFKVTYHDDRYMFIRFF